MQLALNFKAPVITIGEKDSVPKPLSSVLQSIFEEVFGCYRKRSLKQIDIVKFEAEFYPYREFKHTLTIRDKTARIRVSSQARNEPEQFFRSLAHVLWSKIFRMKCPPAEKEYYHIAELRLVREMPAVQDRARKKYLPAPGAVYHLEAIKDRLDTEYFDHALRTVAIGWSRHHAKTRLGHYDRAAKFIMISRILDREEVPPWVIDTIVHHEMLHHIHPVDNSQSRACIHTPDFKSAERKFLYFERCKAWLHEEYPKIIYNQRRRSGKNFFLRMFS